MPRQLFTKPLKIINYVTLLKKRSNFDSGYYVTVSFLLQQATSFLHDNGVLLHYDDATLRDLYFLDPQWLCDMLSHVVTIRLLLLFISYLK